MSEITCETQGHLWGPSDKCVMCNLPREPSAGRIWRHLKRGTVYVELGRAELQMSQDMLVDGSSMVVYRGDDGKLWVRREEEFEDGRFEEVQP